MRAKEEERDEVEGLALRFRHSLHLSRTDSSLALLFHFQLSTFPPPLLQVHFYPPKSLYYPLHLILPTDIFTPTLSSDSIKTWGNLGRFAFLCLCISYWSRTFGSNISIGFSYSQQQLFLKKDLGKDNLILD